MKYSRVVGKNLFREQQRVDRVAVNLFDSTEKAAEKAAENSRKRVEKMQSNSREIDLLESSREIQPISAEKAAEKVGKAAERNYIGYSESSRENTAAQQES